MDIYFYTMPNYIVHIHFFFIIPNSFMYKFFNITLKPDLKGHIVFKMEFRNKMCGITKSFRAT